MSWQHGWPAAVALSLPLGGCGNEAATPPAAVQPRTFRMGFSAIPPRAGDDKLTITAIDLWSRRADAAIFSLEPPWADLLRGIDPETYVTVVQVPLANYYRSKGHQIWIYLDPGNGLNRAGESDPLVAAGRSLTEPAIQQLFRRYAVAMDTQLHPEHLGLALETNLIRGTAPPALYAAIRQVANDAAADVRLRDPVVKLSVSVQVDYAWGHFDGSGFHGVATGFAEPEELPLDYYTRLLGGRTLPLMVVEGGWTSTSLRGIASSPDAQRRYIVRQMQILDGAQAIAVFQLTFTDLDLAVNPPPPGSNLPLFAYLGLVDVNLNPKPALAVWDEAFARPRR